MNGIGLIYFLLGILLCYGARLYPRGVFNEESTSREQTKALTGIMTMGVMLHHLAQKIQVSRNLTYVRATGLDFFTNVGFLLVAVFFFCSGLGLYKSVQNKPDYLKGFVRRRVLLIAVAFYLSEWIYTAVRLLMGQRMDLSTILWYLSGLRMANKYSWYVIVIPFFYLAFWAAFRFCKRKGLAIFWVFAFTLAYTVAGTLIDHQNIWWMQGEWWYNSVILFPLGLLFGKCEAQVTRFFRKGYWIWLLVSAALVILLYLQSDWLLLHRWGYYRVGTRLKVPYRLLSAGCQWLVCIAFVAFCFLLMMKVRIGNKALAWLGSYSLEFYLLHGLFVELFGYDFMNSARSLVQIKIVPLYAAAVIACTVPAVMGFRWVCRKIHRLLIRERKEPLPQPTETEGSGPEKIRFLQIKLKALMSLPKTKKYARIALLPLLFLIMFGAYALLSGDKSSAIVVGGLKLVPPAGYTQTYTDSRYAKWKYTGKDKNPGVLILDRDIMGNYAQKFYTVEEVMESCGDWMTDMELYENPQGIQIVRGYSTKYSEYPDRRYYVECSKNVFLLTMIEDSRYYSVADCEAVMQEVADSLCRE